MGSDRRDFFAAVRGKPVSISAMAPSLRQDAEVSTTTNWPFNDDNAMANNLSEDEPMMRCLLFALSLALLGTAGAAHADEVGSFSNDWTGNGLVVEAFADPGVTGVSCYIVHFDRSVIDRLTKGNWFENPSNSAISCSQTGPITIGKIALGRKGEEIFSQKMSLFFKSIAVRRIYDQKSDALIYVAYSRQIKDASAKMALSTVSLYNTHPTPTASKP